MKLASYTGTRPGVQGIANRLIRARLMGLISHSECVFEPGFGGDHLMPDGTCEPVDGALWCASSVAAEVLPTWSARRAGHMGGVRFKRIHLDDAKWLVRPYRRDQLAAAQWFKAHEGAPYDWQLALGYLAWFIPGRAERWNCSEAVADAGGFTDPWRYDPCVLDSSVAVIGSPM